MKNQLRHYSPLDKMLMHFDDALATVFGQPTSTGRPNPADNAEDPSELSIVEQKHSAGLMRVNHCGEVCAQALYLGQALTSRDAAVKAKLQQASAEENDHLLWCQNRLEQLNSHKSYLNPLWFMSSFSIGLLAGLAGDKWNLGFLAETENQVVKHLSSHLEKLPANDAKSRAIVEQMREDEGHHATIAIESGGVELPSFVQNAMQTLSKVMTSSSYYF